LVNRFLKAAGFDVPVTGDKTLEDDQSMQGRRIAPVALSAPHWQFVKDHVASIADGIRNVTPWSFTRVDVDSRGIRNLDRQQTNAVPLSSGDSRRNFARRHQDRAACASGKG
jgi:hypothetical protein